MASYIARARLVTLGDSWDSSVRERYEFMYEWPYVRILYHWLFDKLKVLISCKIGDREVIPRAAIDGVRS